MGAIIPDDALIRAVVDSPQRRRSSLLVAYDGAQFYRHLRRASAALDRDNRSGHAARQEGGTAWRSWGLKATYLHPSSGSDLLGASRNP